MAKVQGVITTTIVSTSRLHMYGDKQAEIDQMVNRLNGEGKKVVSISVGKVRLVGPFGNVASDVTILWEADDTDPKYISSQVEKPKSSGSSGGCYVATAVYGSYDCPQVWTLRRYRDYTLAKTWYGRAFVRTYYAISPSLVKWFGNTNWFKNMWQKKLDILVSKLQNEGVENTPYNDIEW